MALCRFALIVSAALAAGGFQDDAEIAGWISDLVHPDAARRAAAEKALVKAGPKALPALKAAFESRTPELASRARYVAGEIERIEFEREFDRKQRPRRLEIVSLQVKDAPLADALKVLGNQVDSTLHSAVDSKTKLTLDVRDIPLRMCLDQIEDLLKVTIISKYNWHRATPGAATRKKRAYVPGATFEFGLVPFKVDGGPAGWSLMTDITGPATVLVDAFEVADKLKAAVEVERCGRCGPRYVRLKSESAGPFTVKLKGRVVWENPYEFAVTDPAKKQAFKVGAFDLTYEWPKVAWVSTESFPPHLAGRAEMALTLKRQGQGPAVSGTMGVGGPGPEPRPTRTWCACPAGPSPVSNAPALRISGGHHFDPALRTRKPDDFASLKVRFFKAIEEPFEAEAVVSPD